MINESRHGKLGILVGGGPAPGLNGVIHAATIEAIINNVEVVGIYEGYKYLMEGKVVGKELTIDDVSRIHLRGGSILYTSRANPTKDDKLLKKCGQALIDAGISYLLAIGGDDTAYSAYRVAQYAQENMGVPIRVAHAPKTIDNDLPLPSEIRTFGYETARDLGAHIVMNIMEDGLTGQRWYFIVAMGRKAGHLALGIGKSSGATVTLIPEEWRDRKVRLQEVVDILVTSILRRKAEGKEYGVAILAEGLVEYMDASDLEVLAEAERDEHGHLRLSEINFGEIIKNTVRKELLNMGTDMRIVNKDLGYELRCAPPNAFDIDYTRSLGQAAVDFLLEGGTNATITIQKDQVVPIPFDEMMDPNTGRTEVRMVNVDSFTFRSAYKFMIRLRKEHWDDDMMIARMASFTNLTADQFIQRYGYLMESAPRPF